MTGYVAYFRVGTAGQGNPARGWPHPLRNPSGGQFELQIFAEVADAEPWLGRCQQVAG